MGLFETLGGRPLELLDGERLLHQGPANHWRGIESVGGYLWLTDRRLVFRSHAINAQSGERSWPRAEIARAEAAATMWIIPNGLRITLRDGRREKFVVQERGAWVAALASA